MTSLITTVPKDWGIYSGERRRGARKYSPTSPGLSRAGRQPLEGVIRDEGRSDPEGQEGDTNLPEAGEDDGGETRTEEEGEQAPRRHRFDEDDEEAEGPEKDDDPVEARRRQVRKGCHRAGKWSPRDKPMELLRGG